MPATIGAEKLVPSAAKRASGWAKTREQESGSSQTVWFSAGRVEEDAELAA